MSSSDAVGNIGQVTAADTERGVTVHLNPNTAVETLSQGQFVVVQGRQGKFYGTISGFKLGAADGGIALSPPSRNSRLLTDTLAQSLAYAECSVQLSLAQPNGNDNPPQPARTIPSHFSLVALAQEQDFTTVFGDKETGGRFIIGSPRDMPALPIAIDLAKFVERSNGIFGRSGTGKSMFTRLMLCGLIDNDACVNLVFDMHNEYARSKATEQKGQRAAGLLDLFPGTRVMVCSLDPTVQRGGTPPTPVFIPYKFLTIDDLMAVKEELDLSEAAESTAFLLEDTWGDGWLRRLMQMKVGELKDTATEVGVHYGALRSLWNKLGQLRQFSFLTEDPTEDTRIDYLLGQLQSGRSVILEFGKYDSILAYMLVANIITRRIYSGWKKWSENYERNESGNQRPRPLMITIEEAHKFLEKKGSLFGTIAREMRKYYVTLLVVDQRPSVIDPDVLSQLGTRITALLSDQQDIDAVFAGVQGSSHFKQILGSLDTRQEALVFGHALPMQVVIRARTFDESFTDTLKNGIGKGGRSANMTPIVRSSGNGSSAHRESSNEVEELMGR